MTVCQDQAYNRDARRDMRDEKSPRKDRTVAGHAGPRQDRVSTAWADNVSGSSTSQSRIRSLSTEPLYSCRRDSQRLCQGYQGASWHDVRPQGNVSDEVADSPGWLRGVVGPGLGTTGSTWEADDF